VSDNLKSAVVRACFHEPGVNRSDTDLARHYHTAILPARPYKPKDKAKAEGGVLLVQRWIVARLRNRVFFSLEELNVAILEELTRLKRFGKYLRHKVSPMSREREARQGIGDSRFPETL